MTTEPPTATEDTGLQQPAARQPMSRRRFLAVVGGTAGAVGIAGLAGRSLLGGPGDPAPADAGNLTGLMLADPGVEIVEVEPGFADAAVWNDQLLTLRADPAGTGIILRSETDGIEHPVDAPPDFTARCIGTIDDTLIIGGHRAVVGEEVRYELGADYDSLLMHAGEQARILTQQPHRPDAVAHTHIFVDRLPALVIAVSELTDWENTLVPLLKSGGGSIGAVLGQAGSLAQERFAFAEVPDSISEMFVVPYGRKERTFAGAGTVVPLDHGGVWGKSVDQEREIIIVNDRHRIAGYDQLGREVFRISGSMQVLGVQSSVRRIAVSVLDSQGQRERYEFVDAELAARRREELSSPIVHQSSMNIAMVSGAPQSYQA